MAREDNSILMENAQIIFRNFAGKEGQYNREGDRNFCVLLDNELAGALIRDNWNVKFLTAREEGDEDQAYLQVTVSFKGRPPKVVMITSRGQSILDEDQVEILDWADIQNIDLIIRPYEWSVNGKTGVKAYLKTIFVTIEEDALESKYAELESH